MRNVGYAYSPEFLKHDYWDHPECKGRLQRVMQLLTDTQLTQSASAIPFEAASKAALATVHDADYIDELDRFCIHGGGMVGADTYAVEESFDVAALAVGATQAATRAVMRGDLERAFALVRPPGHHAFADHGEGFCLFNNTAFAARVAIDEFGLERVMILDWDVHHGNGTQAIFYQDPRVLYLSTHQSPLYPGSGEAEEIGHGAGVGTTINVPLPPGVGDAGFGYVWEKIVVPATRRYRPQLIIVSAGYDAHWREQLFQVRMRASLTGFSAMGRSLSDLADEFCGGKLLAVLEGGYDFDVLANGVRNTMHNLLGLASVVDPYGIYMGGETPIEKHVALIRRIHGL
ncbi:MAG: histone deacetylase [Thermoflexales bacterium]|nr:histone deacetylase [Thermoflexales bacterium]